MFSSFHLSSSIPFPLVVNVLCAYGSPLYAPPNYCVRQGLPEPGFLLWLDWLASEALGYSLCIVTRTGAAEVWATPGFTNSSPHTCTASILSTGPFPCPLSVFILVKYLAVQLTLAA